MEIDKQAQKQQETVRMGNKGEIINADREIIKMAKVRGVRGRDGVKRKRQRRTKNRSSSPHLTPAECLGCQIYLTILN